MKSGAPLEKERQERARHAPPTETLLQKERTRIIEVRKFSDRSRNRLVVRAKRNGLLAWNIAQHRTNDFKTEADQKSLDITVHPKQGDTSEKNVSENVESATSATSTTEKATMKPAEMTLGQVYEVVTARNVPGKFGEQVKLSIKGGRQVYIRATSGIAKGLASGKLKMPLRITVTTAYGEKGPYPTVTLAPKA